MEKDTKEGIMVSLALRGGAREREIFEAACTAPNSRTSTSKATTSILMVSFVVVLTKRHHHIRGEELCNLRCDGQYGVGSGRRLTGTQQVQRAHCWIHWIMAKIPSRCQVLMWSHLMRWYLGGVCLLIFSFELRGRTLAANF